MKFDWRGIGAIVALVATLIGWGFTLGTLRAQVEENSKHSDLPFHQGVRALTEANAHRIQALEIGQARIDEKLAQILREIEKLDR